MITTIARIGRGIEATPKLNIVQEDVSDSKFIACAVEGGVDYIVSGDEYLQRLWEKEQ